MSVIIGGSGSSGSTMLISKLSTHSDIFCGGEINFFNKEQLFENWEKYKLKILPIFPFFTTKGWHIYRRNTLSRPEYGWTKKEIKNLLKESKSINDFCLTYFERATKKKGAHFWIEKTPSNSYSFDYFLKQIPDSKVIHIARNPLDTIASIYKKDPRVLYAVGNWLYNNATALAVSHSSRYILVKYEDLVYKTEESFERISDFLKVDSKGLNLNLGIENKQISSWNNSPNAEISDSSMGKFDLLPQDVKDEIYTALFHLKISSKHVQAKGLMQDDFYSVSNELGYSAQIYPNKNVINKIKRDLKLDKLSRTLKGYATGGSYYPLEFA